MVQVIQHKRRIGAGAVGGPPTLAAGELAYNSNGKALFVGDDGTGTVVQLVGVERQLEIHAGAPAQVVAGAAKTFSTTNLKVTGGNPGEFLSTTNVDGTLAYAPMVSASQQFIGSLDATAGTVTLTAAAGGGAALPPVASANGWYVITDVAGSTPPAGAPAGQYEIGDWLISNGTAWTHLFFGGISSVTAADVGVAPTVMGGDDVQEVLTTMESTFVSGPAASVIDNIATYTDLTGLVIKDGGTKISDLATNAYVDSENAAQDLIITANAAFVAAQPGIDSAQDAAIAAAGDVNGTTVSTLDHIATYSDATGKNIKDGAILASDIALLSDLTGLGDVVGPATSTTGNIATYGSGTGKLIADGGILAADLVVQADLAALGDVKGPATATLDHIAVYADTTGKVIKNATKTIASLDADIAAKGDVYGPAAAVVNNLAMYSTVGGKNIVDSGQSITSIQAYVDTAINNIPGATAPDVLEPDLIGDGTAATPITWTGIKFDPLDVPAPFTGVGTTADPLALVLVDGGTY